VARVAVVGAGQRAGVRPQPALALVDGREAVELGTQVGGVAAEAFAQRGRLRRLGQQGLAFDVPGCGALEQGGQASGAARIVGERAAARGRCIERRHGGLGVAVGFVVFGPGWRDEGPREHGCHERATGRTEGRHGVMRQLGVPRIVG
jgi:hypothetical protein